LISTPYAKAAKVHTTIYKTTKSLRVGNIQQMMSMNICSKFNTIQKI